MQQSFTLAVRDVLLYHDGGYPKKKIEVSRKETGKKERKNKKEGMARERNKGSTGLMQW